MTPILQPWGRLQLRLFDAKDQALAKFYPLPLPTEVALNPRKHHTRTFSALASVGLTLSVAAGVQLSLRETRPAQGPHVPCSLRGCFSEVPSVRRFPRSHGVGHSQSRAISGLP